MKMKGFLEALVAKIRFTRYFISRAFLFPPVNKSTYSDSIDSGTTLILADDNEGFESDPTDAKFDSTGMFHWCAPRPFESAVIVSPNHSQE